MKLAKVEVESGTPQKLTKIEIDQPTQPPVKAPPKFCVVATLPDGRKVNIRRDHWKDCFTRAIEIEAKTIVDGAQHKWERDGQRFLSCGIMGVAKPTKGRLAKV